MPILSAHQEIFNEHRHHPPSPSHYKIPNDLLPPVFQDNGSGMPHKDIPNMLGKVLSGTKYGVKQVGTGGRDWGGMGAAPPYLSSRGPNTGSSRCAGTSGREGGGKGHGLKGMGGGGGSPVPPQSM